MSVKELIGGNPVQISRARSYIHETAKKEEELDHHKSHVCIVASTFIREGQKELREISEKLTRSGIQIDPRSTTSIFHQLPPSDRRVANLAYAAVAFGVIMITIDKLLEDKVFIPREMVNLFNYSVNGTFIPRWEIRDLRNVVISEQKHTELLEFRGRDPSLSLILIRGLDEIPGELKGIIENTNLVPFAEKILAPSFRRHVLDLDKQNSVKRR